MAKVILSKEADGIVRVDIELNGKGLTHWFVSFEEAKGLIADGAELA